MEILDNAKSYRYLKCKYNKIVHDFNVVNVVFYKYEEYNISTAN